MSNTKTKTGRDKEEVKKQEEMEGKVEGRKKKKKTRIHMLKTWLLESAA